MSYLVGLIVAFLLFGGLELIWRALGMPLSVFAALGAVLRQTDVAKLQRRQALTMLLLAVGGGLLMVAAVLLADRVFTRIVFSLLGGGLFAMTLAGWVGKRTLRAISRAEIKATEAKASETAKSATSSNVSNK